MYVTQPEVKPGCVLRRANIGLLEKKKLVTDHEVRRPALGHICRVRTGDMRSLLACRIVLSCVQRFACCCTHLQRCDPESAASSPCICVVPVQTTQRGCEDLPGVRKQRLSAHATNQRHWDTFVVSCVI